jgi:hypothetical protein
VSLSVEDDRLRVVVTGHEDGALPLSHIRDRVEATGGTVSMHVESGRVALDAWLPLIRSGAPQLPRPREAEPVRTPTW